MRGFGQQSVKKSSQVSRRFASGICFVCPRSLALQQVFSLAIVALFRRQVRPRPAVVIDFSSAGSSFVMVKSQESH